MAASLESGLDNKDLLTSDIQTNSSDEESFGSKCFNFEDTISRNLIRKIVDVLKKKGTRRKHAVKSFTAQVCADIRRFSRVLESKYRKLELKNIFIITKNCDDILDNLFSLVSWLLQSSHEFYLYVEDKPSVIAFLEENNVDSSKIRFWKEESHLRYNDIDLVITLGGDGTVLRSGHLFPRCVPPVLTFGLGTIGFLANFNFDNYDDILNIMTKKGIKLSLRMRLECTVFHRVHTRGTSVSSLTSCLENQIFLSGNLTPTLKYEELENKPLSSSQLIERLKQMSAGSQKTASFQKGQSCAVLNEVVIARGFGQMTTLEVYVDDKHITALQADGVCISTPTGSTAYSLSAGGTLCHPDIPAILLTPICPHALSSRPLLLPNNVTIKIEVPNDTRTTAFCSFDGRQNCELTRGDFVFIRVSNYPFPVVTSLDGQDWFYSLRRKLGWNQRHRQKSNF